MIPTAKTLALALLTSTCFLTAASALPIDPKTIPEGDYVTVKDGHLSVNGERQRYWAVVDKTYATAGVKPDDSPEVIAQKVATARKSTDIILDRLQEMGCNAIRLWAALPNRDYKVGDGSTADSVDYMIAEAKKRGFRIWTASMNRVQGVVSADVDVLNDPKTREAWGSAVDEASKKQAPKRSKGNEWTDFDGLKLDNYLARYWDPRLEKIDTLRKAEIASHFNHYTGLRWADDPVFAVWELNNEEWWMRKMVGGQWQNLPPFFRDGLLTRWTEFLTKKYGGDDSLKKAWGGLLPEETLAESTVQLAPMAANTSMTARLNDSNQAAIESVQGVRQTYGSADFPAARGRDVLEFFVGLHVSYKKRQSTELKKIGRSIALSPMIFDTGIGYEIQSQFMHQNADAVAHNAYVNGWGPSLKSQKALLENIANPLERKRVTLDAERISANDGFWINWLRRPPGIAQGNPWLETGRVDGKPFLVYETQIQQPAKYRADYPLRVAALASIQDWDWVTWHYFGDNSLNTASEKEHPFERRMDVTTGQHPQGYHLTYDEAQLSLFRAAAFLFRNGAWAHAATLTQFIYGAKSLYDPASMNYGHSYGDTGMDMLQTTYAHGMRMKIDPSREEDEVIGPVVPFEHRNEFNPYRPTSEITIDWKAGYLSGSAPKGTAWAGNAKAGSTLELGQGITFSDIQVRNDEGIFDSMDTENPYFAISVYSLDNEPLATAKRASISIASTSYNSGFTMKGVNEENNKPIATWGDLPILSARMAGTFTIPQFANGTFTMRDFNGKTIKKGKIGSDGTISLSPDDAAWYIELTKNP